MLQNKFMRLKTARLAAFNSMVFVVALLVTSASSYHFISNYLYERLDRHVLERFNEIKNTLEEKGAAAAVKMIIDHGPQIRGEETVYILKYLGRTLYANSNGDSIGYGMSTLEISVEKAPITAFRIRREEFFGYDLTVGVSFDDTNTILKIELLTFLTSSLIILVVSFGSAYRLAKRSQARILRLTHDMNQVARGSFSTRLPVSNRRDDIDALADGINGALSQLQGSVEAIKRMSANVAHDLRAPVAGIRLAIEGCIERVKNAPDVRRSLEETLQDIDELTSTFEAIMKIAEIESGIRRHSFVRLDIGVVAQEVCEIYAPIFEDEKRTLYVCAELGSIVRGDKRLLTQMLINLLNNAIRHTPQGTKVAVTLDANETTAILSLSDNGPGIAEADRERVFEHFVHLAAEGTGLGLSIVKAIAELHEATITLRGNDPGLTVEIRFAVDR